MAPLIATLRKWMQPRTTDGGDALAALLLAAAEDVAFRDQLVFVLRLPKTQRESLINTAIEEMQMRGEPASVRAGFAALSSDEAARTALQWLEAKER